MTEFMAPGKMKIIKHHSKSACEVRDQRTTKITDLER